MPKMSLIDKAINKYASDIQVFQDTFKLTSEKGKYKQFKLGEFQGLDFVQVHEYLCPDGQTGYQVIIRADETDGSIYYKSINVGPETYRNSDWTFYDPNALI